MTKENIKGMLQYKREQADEYLRLVFSAVWELRRPRVHEIKHYVDNLVHEKAVQNSMFVGANGLARIVKEHPIPKKTIHRELNELEKLGLVEHIGDRYIVSDAWIGDLRYFVDGKAQEFGHDLLGRLTQKHYPTKNKFHINLRKLVEILGYFMVCCMLEACRPVPFKSYYHRAVVPNMFNDKLAIKWTEGVIDPQFMLDVFISAISNQIDDKELEEANKGGKRKESDTSGNSIDDGFFPKGPPSTAYFHRKRFLELFSGKGHKEYYDDKKTKPMYQLNEQTYKSTLATLENLFPNYSQAAKLSRVDFFGSPKEFSLKNRYSQKTPLEVGKEDSFSH